ncbi:MAG: DUF4391 domain-containing protein, partial [Clostridiales bacterium]|nr:DUF4391 domain-containing protein [Clostridiales bacterium]
MIGLPKSTEFNKRIPKQKFYENLTVTPALKTAFKEQIKVIYWRNKIASTTMNLAPGTTVTELEVFEIKLNTGNLDEAVLRQIDKEIPYHILFLLEYEEKYQAWIGYKEAAQSGNNVFKVTGYYHTDWLAEDALGIKADGLNVDAVYENFVRQIAGDKLQTATGESLEETVARAEKKKQLQKQIDVLQTKIRKEKQLNK